MTNESGRLSFQCGHVSCSVAVPPTLCALFDYIIEHEETALPWEQVWLRDSLNMFTVIGLAVIMLGLRLYHSMGSTEEARDNFDPASSPAYG